MALNSPRILVVDDNDAGRYVKVHTLRTSGFAVSEATTGAEAVELTSREGADLVVLDVKLPDISGIEVCRRVKATCPGTMVLQTSAAFIGAKDRAAGLQGGADSYLIEPIDPPELVASVKALLRTRHAESELRQLNRQLEQRVAERTDELEQANRRLQAEIEERRRTETALRLAEKMELVGQLTGGIAHDFNNLLTVISGNLELLAEAVSGGKPIDPARLQRMMAAAQNATSQAARLTRRLLVLSRRDDPRPQPARIGRILSGLEEFVRRTLGEAVALELFLEPQGWSCHIDQIQFETAVLNLAVNARDAMPDGGVFAIRTANVTIGADRSSDVHGDIDRDIAAGDYVLLTVSDTGIGMDEDVLERAFEPFFTTKDVGKGSGLGLSQVHSFVGSAGGGIKVESAPGKGTSFHIYLPRSAQEERKRPESEEAVSVAGGGCETILVVEDDPAVLEVALRTIRGLGYDVITALNGPEALDILRARPVDLVFSDVVMPEGMNGYQLAVAARAIDPGVKILLTSGYSAGHRPGHDPSLPMLHKPYTRVQLAARIRAVLDERREDLRPKPVRQHAAATRASGNIRASG
jgi:signal transduction histidine kinase